MRPRSILTGAALAVAITAFGSAEAFAGDHRGFKTAQPSMLTPVKPGVKISPLLTVGDVLRSGYRFESIPDGISVNARHHSRVDLFVNHETGKVPFPYNPANPTAANGENDFDNSQVSRLTLDRHSARVLRGSFAITSDLGYQRFCSNYLATWREGFDRKILFTNEESPDWVYRQEASWPPMMGDPAEEEAGLVIALDVKSGKHKPIYGMGRHNHENSVPIPGYGKPVVFSGDDTFTSGPLTGVFPAGAVPSQSQLYSYIARSTKSLLADEGDLWAFVSDTPGVKNYYDVAPGSGTEVKGHFIKVPRDIATGKNPDGSELKAADKGFPLPPANGSWQTDIRSDTPVGIDGPQWVLEYWSDINNVFQFVRVEDIAYDKRPGKQNVVYIVDSGRGRTAAQSLDTPFRSTNGRVWKMVLDRHDPTVGEVAHGVRRGRRQPGQDTRRDASAGQPRDHAQRHAGHGGSGLEPAVPGRFHRSRCNDRKALARPVLGLTRGCAEGRPDGRTAAQPMSTAEQPATWARGSRAASSTPLRPSGAARS